MHEQSYGIFDWLADGELVGDADLYWKTSG